jgi:hypothetical protein
MRRSHLDIKVKLSYIEAIEELQRQLQFLQIQHCSTYI